MALIINGIRRKLNTNWDLVDLHSGIKSHIRATEEYFFNTRQCICCGKDLPYKKRKGKFCNKSCAAIFNNKLSPKRKKFRKCKSCKINMPTGGDVMCAPCRVMKKEIKEKNKLIIENYTLGELLNAPSVKDKHPSWKSAYIRVLAREQHKNLMVLPCVSCGYDKHVEICHIKPVSSFNEEDKVRYINHLDNVIQLCRNCHWEFDHGLVDKDLVLSKKFNAPVLMLPSKQ